MLPAPRTTKFSSQYLLSTQYFVLFTPLLFQPNPYPFILDLRKCVQIHASVLEES